MGNPAGVKRDFEGLERRRMAAAKLLQQGVSQAEVARRVGVHRQSVIRWVRELRKSGRAGLAARWSVTKQPSSAGRSTAGPSLKKARWAGQTIVFVDESGLSERPHRCRTWAPRGQTPVLQYNFNWKLLSAMAGITWWRFYFRLFPGAIRGPRVIEFLTHLLAHLPGRSSGTACPLTAAAWSSTGSPASGPGSNWSACPLTRRNSTRWSTSGATGNSMN